MYICCCIQSPMNLLIAGLDHTTAPSFSSEQLHDALGNLRRALDLPEAALLSTCNRTEVLCRRNLAGETSGALLMEWLCRQRSSPIDSLEGHYYVHSGMDAVQHMMRLASGLESMILGEPQIAGQMKSAYLTAHQTGNLGPELERAFQWAFRVSRKVRSNTAIGRNPVSVASAAVKLAERIFSDLATTRVLVVGSGKNASLVAHHLTDRGVSSMSFASRSPTRGNRLAARFTGKAINLSSVPDHLIHNDIVICSTASQLPLIGKGMLEKALKRRRRPIFMVDLAVPRDVEEQAGELADVYLYNIDDLNSMVDSGRESRQKASEEAQQIIAGELGHFKHDYRSQIGAQTIKACRTHIEALRDRELAQALSRLRQGAPAEELLSSLAYGLTNRMLHHPSSAIRKAAASGRSDLVHWAGQIFGVAEDEEPPES